MGFAYRGHFWRITVIGLRLGMSLGLDVEAHDEKDSG
jgi:hypothetical protein